MTTRELAQEFGIRENTLIKRANLRGITPHYRSRACGGRERVFTSEEARVLRAAWGWAPKPAPVLSFSEFMRKVEAA
jgi:hypothetical protein